MKPWPNPLNKAPSPGGEEGRERERERNQVRAKRATQ